jgi:hypothetical protein
MGGVTSIGFGCFGTNTILDSEANRILKNHTEGVPDWKTLVEKKKQINGFPKNLLLFYFTFNPSQNGNRGTSGNTGLC